MGHSMKHTRFTSRAITGWGATAPSGEYQRHGDDSPRARRVAERFERVSLEERDLIAAKLAGHPHGRLLFSVIRKLDPSTFTDREARELLSPLCIRDGDGSLAKDVLDLLSVQFDGRDLFSVSATGLAIALRTLSRKSESPIPLVFADEIKACCPARQ